MPGRQRLNEKGLTLIELLAVIVILAIVAAIAIPSIQSVMNNQRDKAIISDIVQLVATAKIQISDNECIDMVCTYSPTLNEISFSSNKFTTAKVDFSAGDDPDQIKITVEDSLVFAGSKKDVYHTLISTSGGFTERQLLDALNN